jgi:hypothetical protein
LTFSRYKINILQGRSNHAFDKLSRLPAGTQATM